MDNDQLLEAASRGDIVEVNRCLDAGINVNVQNLAGRTALHNAAEDDHVDCLRYLIEKGADIEMEDRNIHTALLVSAMNGSCECLVYLVSKGANIQALGHKNYSALHLATLHEKYDCVKHLLTSGADYTIKNDDGNMAIELNTDENIKSMIQSFIDAKAENKALDAVIEQDNAIQDRVSF